MSLNEGPHILNWTKCCIENPKRFWGFIKGLRTENTGIAPLKDSTGMTQSDGSKKVDILNCQLSSVFNKDEQLLAPHWQFSNLSVVCLG
jgi:hypothetical protein